MKPDPDERAFLTRLAQSPTQWHRPDEILRRGCESARRRCRRYGWAEHTSRGKGLRWRITPAGLALTQEVNDARTHHD